jgi:hypothetical protein
MLVAQIITLLALGERSRFCEFRLDVLPEVRVVVVQERVHR